MSNSSVWKIKEQYAAKMANTWNQKGSFGVFAGGRSYPADTQLNTIESIQINQLSNSVDFGDLTVARDNLGENSGGNFTRGFVVGGSTPSNTNAIDAITYSSSGGGTDFGDSAVNYFAQCSASDNTRLVIPQGDGRSTTITALNMSTQGNGFDFGDATDSVFQRGALSSPTRMVAAGGSSSPTAQVNTMQYVTIQSLGNATDFGDLNYAPRSPTGNSNGTRGVFAGGLQFFGGGDPSNSGFNNIDYITIASTGNASDFGDLTASIYGADGSCNSTRALFAGGATYPANVSRNNIDAIEFSTTGNATDFGDLTGAKRTGTGMSNGHGGLEVGTPRVGDEVTGQQVYFPGNRGLLMGGNNPGISNNIQVIELATTGNASDFGDTAVSVRQTGGNGNQNIAVMWGGTSTNAPSTTRINNIQYVSFSTKGNAADYGDLTTVLNNPTSNIGNSTRGISAGGTEPTGSSNVISYIEYSSIGNATDFGDLTAGRNTCAGASSPTRGLIAGGEEGPTLVNTIEYITIASVGNSTDFGDLNNVVKGNIGLSSSTRGIFGAGNSSPTPFIDVIDYVTIASTGNATDFGDVTVARQSGSGLSNSTRGVFAGGATPTASNVMDYITIATTGNATDFGDLAVACFAAGGGSNGHGGL